MKNFHIHSVKRDNSVIIGVAGFLDNFKQPIRIYEEILHVYHHQRMGDSTKYIVHYYNNENPPKECTFELKTEKDGENYNVVIPDNDEQRTALKNLPEYVYQPTDAI